MVASPVPRCSTAWNCPRFKTTGSLGTAVGSATVGIGAAVGIGVGASVGIGVGIDVGVSVEVTVALISMSGTIGVGVAVAAGCSVADTCGRGGRTVASEGMTIVATACGAAAATGNA